MSIFKKVEADNEFVDLVYNINKDIGKEFTQVKTPIDLNRTDYNNKSEIKKKGNLHNFHITLSVEKSNAVNITSFIRKIAQKYNLNPSRGDNKTIYAKYSKDKKSIYTMEVMYTYQLGILTQLMWTLRSVKASNKIALKYYLKESVIIEAIDSREKKQIYEEIKKQFNKSISKSEFKKLKLSNAIKMRSLDDEDDTAIMYYNLEKYYNGQARNYMKEDGCKEFWSIMKRFLADINSNSKLKNIGLGCDGDWDDGFVYMTIQNSIKESCDLENILEEVKFK